MAQNQNQKQSHNNKLFENISEFKYLKKTVTYKLLN
jgi:hypothetical protein